MLMQFLPRLIGKKPPIPERNHISGLTHNNLVGAAGHSSVSRRVGSEGGQGAWRSSPARPAQARSAPKLYGFGGRAAAPDLPQEVGRPSQDGQQQQRDLQRDHLEHDAEELVLAQQDALGGSAAGPCRQRADCGAVLRAVWTFSAGCPYRRRRHGRAGTGRVKCPSTFTQHARRVHASFE
jgi:hypothetical protein